MKTKQLLLLLLMAVFAPLTMHAQTINTLTVCGDSTTTNECIPIYGYFANHKPKCEFIIPAAKLNAMNGGVVSAMKFYLSSSGNTDDISANFNVFVKEVDATTLSGFTGMTNATPVFNDTISIAKGQSNLEIDIPFSSYYHYGGRNLLVGVYQTSNTEDFNRTLWTGESQSEYTAWREYESVYNPYNECGERFLPKTTFTYEQHSTPTILFPVIATMTTGYTTTLTASTLNVYGTPDIIYSSSNTDVATVSGSGTAVTVTGVSAGTANITATLFYNGIIYTTQCLVTVEDAAYCTPETGNVNSEGIYNVTFGTNGVVVNNTVGPVDYGDYSQLVGAVDAGTTCEVDITYKTGWTYGTIIWVDWDNNSTFEGSEAVYAGTSSSANPTTLHATFPIPAATPDGDYRLRIIGSDYGLYHFVDDLYAAAGADPCGAYRPSTCHDYTLRVTSSGAYHITCNTSAHGIISANHGLSDAGNTITVTAVPDINYELTALSYNDGSDHSISFTNNQGSFIMPAADVTVSATFSVVLRNMPPYDLTIGTPGSRSIELGWTGVSSNTNHQYYELMYYPDPNLAQTPVPPTFIGDITATSYELTGLDSITTYFVWVRDNCGLDGISEWVAFTVFTTDVTCHTPTDLTISQLMPTYATLNWNGDAGQYRVRYREAAKLQASLYDDFEKGHLNDWYVFTEGESLEKFGINKEGWFDDDGTYSGFPARSGRYAASSLSNYYTYQGNELNTDNWLVTPWISLGGILKFWVFCNSQDRFEVLLCTNSILRIENFTTTLREMDFVERNNWTEITVDLSSYSGSGHIAIHHVEDHLYRWGGSLLIDDFGIYHTVAPSAWVEAITTENSYTITGLDPNVEYEWQVQAICGSNDGESSWTPIYSFRTPDPFTVPSELPAEPMCNDAELSWNGASETYDLQYEDVSHKAVTIIVNNAVDYIEHYSGNPTPPGYQLVLDADHNTYGPLIDPDSWNHHFTVGNFDDFEYTVPVTASCNYSPYSDCALFHNASATITIPPGVYDYTFLIRYPTSHVYFDYHDNFEFEPGKTYEFTISRSNYHDVISTTITDHERVWTYVGGITNPYTFSNLSPETTYEWRVRGSNVDGNNSNTEWSEVVTSTTLGCYTKDIEPYTTDGGYYLIASPIGTVSPEDVSQMTENTYDLYSFDQNQVYEWRNYQTGAFENLEAGKGYLYANSGDVTLTFTGHGYNGNGEVTLAKNVQNNPTGGFEGWNLVGNPFAQKAYITERGFYTMNEDGTEFQAVTGNSVEAMEGILVIAEEDGETLTFTTEKPFNANRQIVLDVSHNRGNAIDRAIIRFGEGDMLPKFMLNKDNTKVYIPQDNNEYAMVRSSAAGDIPVNFKAAQNGTYTINISTEELDVNYLHLIDNLTGAEIDLLQNPSYSFSAKTDDYASRFRLVFAANSEDGPSTDSESFAFVSNGNIVVNGSGILQVIDMMGRVVVCRDAMHCVSTTDMTPGVYVLRLINDDNVKTQKIVIE